MVAHIQPIRTRIYRPQTNLLCRPIENGLHLELYGERMHQYIGEMP